MKIAIAVHGRFFAFDLANALIKSGHDVRIFTNYPRWAARRFGIPAERVSSFWMHGVLARMAHRFGPKWGLDFTPVLHRLFAGWAARKISRENWDVIQAFSGVAEEIFQECRGPGAMRQLVRGSCHIEEQDRLLLEEEVRCGVPAQRPGAWMIEREKREYALADNILVLSSFAHKSFAAAGVNPKKLTILPLGVDTDRFRPGREAIEARCRRIQGGKTLRVLTVGTMSPQKGLADYLKIVKRLSSGPFDFRFVGDVLPEAEHLIAPIRQHVEFIPRQPEHDLPRWYEWGDMFMFPTIQDGFAVVLMQAYASGLIMVTTDNCSGPDFIRADRNGWTLPIRDVDGFVNRLMWCHENRSHVARMVEEVYADAKTRTWTDVARDYARLCSAGAPAHA